MARSKCDCVSVAWLFTCAASVLIAGHAVRGQCGFDWAPGFNLPGLNAPVYTLETFDDGSGRGPELYAGGSFTAVDGSNAGGLAKWNGKNWVTVDDDFVKVDCLKALPDLFGQGTAIFASGQLKSSEQTVYHVTRWDGAAWIPIGGWMNYFVHDLEVFDDGSGWGLQLYAAGAFSQTENDPNLRVVAKWDGSSWVAVGQIGALSGTALALEVFDNDGSGPNSPALYVGGSIGSGYVQNINHIAKWDGKNWQGVSGGVLQPSPAGSGQVRALTVHDEDGPGQQEPKLFVGGYFSTAGGVPAKNIARWDGVAWSPLAGGVDSYVYEFAADTGIVSGAPALYVGGSFTLADGQTVNGIAQWNGTAWSPLSLGLNGGGAGSIALLETGNPDTSFLFAGGEFLEAGKVEATYVARWDGVEWTSLAEPASTASKGIVTALIAFDDGDGEKLYAGLAAGLLEPPIVSFARLDGTEWSFVGELVDWIGAFAVFDDGSGGGPALYAGCGGGVRKWNGQEWQSLPGLTGGCQVLVVHDGALYAGGFFTLVGVPFSPYKIVKWDGKTVTPVLSTIGPGGLPWFALASFDDGSGTGPSLYFGASSILVNGQIIKTISRWTGTEWTTVGGGLKPAPGWQYAVVSSMAVFDDGTGPALYAAGHFGFADDKPVNNIAKWDGSQWSDVGGGLTSTSDATVVHELSVFNNELIACGYFTHADNAPIKYMAKWDGKTWSALGLGIESKPDISTFRALAVMDDSLFVGGKFTHAGGLPSHNIAKWTDISDAPQVVEQPSDVETGIGTSATFTVTAWGGDLNYQWRKNGTALFDGENISGSQAPTLQIEDVTGQDAGIFDILISTDCGMITSEPAAMNVYCQFDVAPNGLANGLVNVDDLLAVINAWGQADSQADVNFDGIVNALDLAELIDHWGECP